ncbi:TRAP transporter substrate-binding protein [Rhodovulum sp. YEN HP10]|uniref:TRAP transporter substrate-binding protein n=1 Tax=Rhodovulum sp. HP10 TaxID=3387397 RepID=UPI0039E1A246
MPNPLPPVPMPLRPVLSALCALGLLLGAVLAPGPAGAQPTGAVSGDLQGGMPGPVHLRIGSFFPVNMPVLGRTALDLAEHVERMSGDTLLLSITSPSAAAPALDTIAAMNRGALDGALAAAEWYTERDSAFGLLASMPFGPTIDEYLAWYFYGGGREIARELYRAYDVHNILCGVIPSEASGWFPHEMTSVDDLAGMRMRFFGLGAKVMQRFGAEVVAVGPEQLFEALETGRIDAAEFSLPAIDARLGLHKLLKYYYFPGWHQPLATVNLYIPQSVWSELPDHHKAILEAGCGDMVMQSLAEGEALQAQALRAIAAEGVELRRWPAAMLVAFESAWWAVVAEESRLNPNFARVYASLAKFRADRRTWRHLSFLQ